MASESNNYFRHHRMNLPSAPGGSSDANYHTRMRQLVMDEFNRLSSDFYDLQNEVLASGSLPLIPVNSITATSITNNSAAFTWELPAQVNAAPTQVRVRILEISDGWAEYSYPFSAWSYAGLTHSTQYTFQVQLIRRVEETVAFYDAFRNCPAVPVIRMSESPIRSFVFTTLPGISDPIPDPGGTGGDTIIPIPDVPGPGAPGPVGGSDCWWEWEFQKFAIFTGFTDTGIGGEVAGDAGEISYDLNTLDPGIYRVKYCEICDSVEQDCNFGNLFSAPTDWTLACGGAVESPSLGTGIYTDAIYHIPYICQTETSGLQIRDGVSGTVLTRQSGLVAPLNDTDNEWGLLSGDFTQATQPLVSGELAAINALHSQQDFTIMMSLKLTELPGASLPFNNATIINLGQRIRLTVQQGSSGWTAGAVAPRDTGGAVILNSNNELALNEYHAVVFRCDADGDKELFVNGQLASIDDSGEFLNLDDADASIAVHGISTSVIRQIVGWDRLLTNEEIGEFAPPPPTYRSHIVAGTGGGALNFGTDTLPAGVQIGDLLTAYISMDNTSTPTTPDDWTLVAAGPNLAGIVHRAYYRTYDGSFTSLSIDSAGNSAGILIAWEGGASTDRYASAASTDGGSAEPFPDLVIGSEESGVLFASTASASGVTFNSPLYTPIYEGQPSGLSSRRLAVMVAEGAQTVTGQTVNGSGFKQRDVWNVI